MLLDVLARTITPPETSVVQLSDLDSTLASYGARFARVLTQDRLPYSFSRARC